MTKNRQALLLSRLAPGTCIQLRSDDATVTVVSTDAKGAVTVVRDDGEEAIVRLGQVIMPDTDAGAAELREVLGMGKAAPTVDELIQQGEIGTNGKATKRTPRRLPDAGKLKARPVNEARRLGTDQAGAPKMAKTTKAPSVVGAAPVVKDRTPAHREAKATRDCCCGCGEQVTGHFRMGHDARFHGWMRRISQGKLDPATIPASAVKLMSLVGGKPTTDWDGSSCDRWTAGIVR